MCIVKKNTIEVSLLESEKVGELQIQVNNKA